MMGWRPEHVRSSTLYDFEAAFEGWMKAQGLDLGPDMSDDAVRELEELMERYPDE